MKTIKETLMERDQISSDEADELIQDAVDDFRENPDDPEETLQEWFGLEPDYVMEFLFLTV